jgi:hypothetical protein
MAHNVNPRAYNEYLARHGVPPGPGHWTAPVCRGHHEAEGPDQAVDFERWWGNAGPWLREYVRRCEEFVRDSVLRRVRQQEQALAEAVRDAGRGPDYEPRVERRRPIARELDNLQYDIEEFQRRFTRAEERLERVRARSVMWTQEQFDRHPAEIAVHDRAEAGAKLLRRIARELRVYTWSACERELLARVARWARLAEAWLADAIR